MKPFYRNLCYFVAFVLFTLMFLAGVIFEIFQFNWISRVFENRNLNIYVGEKPEGNCGESLTQNCQYIYIDLGTNIGHQIRKLYEPHLYPGNPTESIFTKYFSNDTASRRNNVCAFGFEPNPLHTQRLNKLESAYRKLGIRLKIFTSTAASIVDSNSVKFYRDEGASTNNEWGASLTTDTLHQSSKKTAVDITSKDVVKWLKYELLSCHPRAKAPVIVMKIDIEGHDNLVLGSSIVRGAFCHIDCIYGESHVSPVVGQLASFLRNLGVCKTQYVDLDDESGNDNLPLP